MKCFYHVKRWAQAKIGTASGSMFSAFLPLFAKKFLNAKTWVKNEIYVCASCKKEYDEAFEKGVEWHGPSN